MQNSELQHENEELKLKLKKLELLKAKAEEQARLRREKPWMFVHKFYDWQREVLESTAKKQVLVASNQCGKAIRVNELVATPGGWRQIGSLKVGDQVIGENGLPCNVVAIPWEGEDLFYEVTFSDGTSIQASQSHVWRCKGPAQRFSRSKDGDGGWELFTTKGMYLGGRYGESAHQPAHRFVVPYVEPVEYPEKDLFDPYALGVILGDGCISNLLTISNPEESIKDYFVDKFNSYSCWHDSRNCYTIRLSADYKLAVESFGLAGTRSFNKFIPREYLHGSVEQRLALLRGLMDTDGTIDPRGIAVEYNTASLKLANDFCELIFSLGGTCKKTVRDAFYWHNGVRKQGLDSYRIRIKLPPGVNPFWLAKKKSDRWEVSCGNIRYAHERVIRNIRPIGKLQGRCITVDSPHQCFVAGKNYVVTHNSSIAIKKNIELATNKSLWPKFFPQSIEFQGFPRAFWYLYPSLKVATSEFEEKWRALMPPMDHPEFGWAVRYRGRDIDVVEFKNGAIIRFKTYMQNVHLLQAGSLDFITFDEEVPVETLPELQMRVQATNGYMLFVFTATRGQNFWRKVVEERSEWKDAQVWQVSLYDCQYYEDGSPSQWTTRRIAQAIANCTSDAQVQRRIFGRFVRDEGLKFEVFNREKNVVEYTSLGPGWKYYVGADYGSGGTRGHPSAVAVVAVNDDYTEARVVGCWRGDKTSTTAEDVVNKIQEMTAYIKDDDLMWIRYDYSASDIGTIAQRKGFGKYEKADKSRDSGIATIQSLLKNGSLKVCLPSDHSFRAGIADDLMQTHKLIEEFENLGVDDPKTQAEDDCCDALRYCLNGIPFDWETIGAIKVILAPKQEPSEVDLRRERGYIKDLMDEDLVEQEIEYWNGMMED